jgi:hypothetical protein
VPGKAGTWFLAILFTCLTAAGQTGTGEAGGSIFDSIARELNRLGEMIGPGPGSWFGLEEDPAEAGVTQTREFSENCPVRANALVSVYNEFGEIRVETWENQVVQVRAEIAAQAETGDLALEIANATEIRVIATEDHVELRTEYPDTRDSGYVRKEVNYSVKVPPNARVVCDNNFGDTIVHGATGNVGVNSRFGHVDLRDIAGLVSVRASGGEEFTLQANGLRGGGNFELNGTEAEFGNISGALRITGHRSSVTLRNLLADADVTSESGPIHLYVPETAEPDLTVSALSGLIRSAVEMTQTSQGNLVTGRSSNVASKQRISLHTAFSDVYVYREGVELPPSTATDSGTEFVDGSNLERAAPIAEGMTLMVDAVRGDIRLEGSDDDRVRIKAARVIRLQPVETSTVTARAPAALEALSLDVDEVDDRIIVGTSVRDDVTALGLSYYRIDLEIQCPRTVALKIRAASGHTTVSGMGAEVAIEQDEGTLSVSHCKGKLELTNRNGSVDAANCAGPAAISARQGTATTLNIHGNQTVICVDGKTVIDAPQAEVVVRNHGGDVRILALDGILGNYNVQVEEGDLSIAVPDFADAEFIVSTTNGIVYPSAVTLTGTVERDRRDFRGHMNDGRFEVKLETKNGDIVID